MVNQLPIENVQKFKYLGRMINTEDGDWDTINYNVKRAREAWGALSRVLSVEGASPKQMASVYKAVIQAELIYGPESWALATAMGNTLQSFHSRVLDI
jgi:hypothetical protein